MSKELLKALVDVLDDLKLRKNLSEDDALNISDSVLMRAENAIKNYLAQPEHTAVDNAVYTVSWHEKKHRDDNWEVRRHIVSNPELIKMFLTFNKQLSELIFGKNIIWGLQMQEGEPTKEYVKTAFNVIPLYTTPPTREPLSDEVHEEPPTPDVYTASPMTHREAYLRGYEKAVCSLKREPLSEDKLDVLSEANITDEGIAGYYLGFRDAEKMYGIGGGE